MERFHRTLKAALTARCNGPHWRRELPWVLLGIRTTPHAALNTSPAEALYGQALQIPADILLDDCQPLTTKDVRNKVSKIMPTKTYTREKTIYIPKDLKVAPYVFMRVDLHRPPLSPPYTGPHQVLQRKEKAFKILLDGGESWVSIDRLKPAYIAISDD